MEKPPGGEMPPNQEKELPFEEQVALATKLIQTTDERNRFIEGFGGFDNFAEAWQHVDDNRARYDEYEKKVLLLRQEIQDKISDKKAFVEQLKEAGHDTLADQIAKMFAFYIPKEKKVKDSFLSRFRKKL